MGGSEWKFPVCYDFWGENVRIDEISFLLIIFFVSICKMSFLLITAGTKKGIFFTDATEAYSFFFVFYFFPCHAENLSLHQNQFLLILLKLVESQKLQHNLTTFLNYCFVKELNWRVNFRSLWDWIWVLRGFERKWNVFLFNYFVIIQARVTKSMEWTKENVDSLSGDLIFLFAPSIKWDSHL